MHKLLMFLAVFLTVPVVQAGALENLQGFLEATKTLRADFSQVVISKNGKKPQQSTGVMMISRPGKFRWQIDRPDKQILVGDGERVWIYDPDLRQVTVRKMDAALGSTPAALLLGGNSLEKRFTLRETGENDGLAWVEAVPKQADGGFERLTLGFSGANLRVMTLFDNFGQVTTFNFSRLERNTVLDPANFRFKPPAGVDVIGE